MRALILAAGAGERLRPHTDDTPKPMLVVGGKPVLQYNVEMVRDAGVRDVLINLHHRPEAVIAHFGDGAEFGVSISYAYEAELLGTAGTIRNAAAFLGDDDFFVVYGDNIARLDLRELAEFHRSKKAVVTIALFHREDPRASGIVEIDAHGRVTRFLEKPAGDSVFSKWVNAGYLAVSSALLGHIPAKTPCDLGHDVLPQLIVEGVPVYGYRMTGDLWWIDTVPDYENVKTRFERRAP